jgi:hypothetical protein
MANIGTSFARRRSTATSFRSIADGPPALDGGDHPPSLRKERTHKHLPPNDLSPNNRLDDIP